VSSAELAAGPVPPPAAPPVTRRSRLAAAALGVVLAAAAVVLLVTGRNTSFQYDEWDIVLDRMGWNPNSLLHAHNEHLIAVPVLLWKLVLEVAGLGGYGALRVLQVVVLVALAAAVFAYARRRVGDVVGVAAAGLTILIGTSYWNLIWPFQLGFDLALLAGVGVLLCLDRGSRRSDVAACALLCVALGSASLGISLLLLVLIEVLWRADRWRRIWIVVVPAVLYGAWLLKYGTSGNGELYNIPEIPRWIYEAAQTAAAAIFTTSTGYGAILVAALVFLVGRRLALPGPIPPRLVGLVAAPLSFWALTAFARADIGTIPGEPRYLLPGALWLMLVAIELAGDHPLPRPKAAWLVAGLLAVGAAAGANALEAGGDILRERAEVSRGSIAALEAVGPANVPDSTLPDLTQPQLSAGPYAQAVEKYGGSPAPSLAELAGASARERAEFDAALLRMAPAQVEAVPRRRATGAPPEGAAATGGELRTVRSCLRLVPAGDLAELTLPVPEGGLVVRAADGDAELRLRRYADGFPEAAAATAAAGQPTRVAVAPVRAPRPWVLGVRSRTTVTVCPA
jgi:hypothetical protein